MARVLRLSTADPRINQKIHQQSAPAVVVFAREPIPGCSKTRLVPLLGRARSAALADAFIRDALLKARSLKPARLVIAATAHGRAGGSSYFRKLARSYRAELLDQGGGSLGHRMARVLTHFLKGGALVFGTDTPSLPVALLAGNLKLLRRSPLVLGPSLDGGYYLIAARATLPDIFRGIRWGGPDVLCQTIARLRHVRAPYSLGPWWYDVDLPDDLFMLVQHLRIHRGPDPCPATSAMLRRLGLL